MIEKHPGAEIREYCRARIESLELWLRRLIDGNLSEAFGTEYLDFQDQRGNRLIKKQLADSLRRRVSGDPGRYPRRIDAILLDDAVSIVCNPELFKDHFRTSLGSAFPGGADVIRRMLDRVVAVRNRLAHANPISRHDAVRVICYSSDVIEALRNHYMERGMNNEYNVPTIIKVSDSFGNIFHRDQFSPVHDGGIIKSFAQDRQYDLRPGDILTIEIEVDPAFDPASYTIRWASTRQLESIATDQPKIVIPITNKFVAAQWDLQCSVTSDEDWHRMSQGSDDFLFLAYKVLPPLR